MTRKLNWPVVAVLALLTVVWGAVTAGMLRAEPAASLASGISAVHVAPSPTAPGDSAIIVASWGSGCDWRGCPSQYEVTWGGEYAGQSASLPARTTTQRVDSLTVPWPAWGDSLLIGVSVRSLRRGQWSSPAMGSAWVVRRDVPPPAPDSLRVIPDTIALQHDAAWRDSFPETLWEMRPATGWQYALEGADSAPLAPWGETISVAEGYWTVVCGFALNRYTGARVLLDATDALPEDRAACRALAETLASLRDV